MPKFFVISDIHGYYDEMMAALDEAGFDADNEDHWLISCGDHFDRGPKPFEVMMYLEKLPRKVLIRGNHENLLVDLCKRTYPLGRDIHNGTWRTVMQMGLGGLFEDPCEYVSVRVKPFLNQMRNYFETENYIFVHSWIPRNKNWRESSQGVWDEAMWGNPYEQSFFPGKTIVFGHWHCSAGWAMSEGRSEFGEDARFDPYYGDGFISIDGCTAFTRKCNVIVLEDDFLKVG